VGTSGSGKSSLVNCGLQPALHQGLMAGSGTNWRVVKFRPGNQPIRAMAEAMAAKGVLFRDFKERGLSLFDIVDSTLRMSTVGLLDIVEQASQKDTFPVLLVVDQFEELFRYHQLNPGASSQSESSNNEEASAFVNLLLAVLEQPQDQIHIVLTMRSDFLGDCTQFPGLAEAINRSLYLVPRMTRDERRAAITSPVLVAGATISPVLVTQLVNDVGDNPDQLSILQHALNRTWERWRDEGENGPLTLCHYQAIGTMATALDRHADEAFTDLADEGQTGKLSDLQELCRRAFQALTDKASDGRGIRRPTKWSDLCEITTATEAQLLKVVEAFRKPSRSFLMPPEGTRLEDDTVIDISHESLMRVWRRLSSWGDQEAKWAEEYRRLAETAIRHKEGIESLLRDPALQIAEKWWMDSQPNQAWAQRYHPGYELTDEFLKQSIRARAKEQEAKQTAIRQRRKKERRTLIASVAISIAAVLSAGYMWRLKDESARQLGRTWKGLAESEIKEHQINPESSIEYSLAALNSNLGDSDLDSVEIIVNLLKAIDMYGEQDFDDRDLANTTSTIWSLAVTKGNDLISVGQRKGDFSIRPLSFDQRNPYSSTPRDVSANLENPNFLRLANDNIVAVGTLAKDKNNMPSSAGKIGDTYLQLWNSDISEQIIPEVSLQAIPNINGNKSVKLNAVQFINQIPTSGDLVIADYRGNLALLKQDLSKVIGSRSAEIDRTRNPYQIKSLIVLQDGNILTSATTGVANKLELLSPDLVLLERIELGFGGGYRVDSLLQLKSNSIISGSYDGTLQLWSPELKKIGPRVESKQIRSIHSLAELDNGEFISGAANGSLRRWTVNEDRLTPLHLPFPTDHASIETLLAVKSTLFSGGTNGSLNSWRWNQGEDNPVLGKLNNNQGFEIVTVSPHFGGRIYRVLSGARKDKVLEIGSISEKAISYERTTMLAGGDKEIQTIYSLLLLQNGDLVTGHGDGSVQHWRLDGNNWRRNGAEYKQDNDLQASVIWSMTEAKNNDLVVGMENGQIHRLRFNSTAKRYQPNGRACKPKKLRSSPIYSLLTLSNGDIVSGSRNGTIVRWKQPDLKWCETYFDIKSDDGQIFSITELHDRSMLTSTNKGGVSVWQWARGNKDRKNINQIHLKGVSAISSSAALANDQIVFSGFDGTVLTFPNKKEAIRRGCEAIKTKLMSKKENLSEYQQEAKKACKKYLRKQAKL
jgi:WD40 repeat protein